MMHIGSMMNQTGCRSRRRDSTVGRSAPATIAAGPTISGMGSTKM